MCLIYLIIFIISINHTINGNISKNSTSNRFLIIPSCQANKDGLKSIPKSSDRSYYFYFSSQSPSSLSSSSSFLPSLHLSYCEHQHTTYYSPSGFPILRSSPRLPLTDIHDKEDSSSFYLHNAILSAVGQSSSSSSNMITTLMSSSSSSSPPQEKHVLVDNDDNMILTTINSLTTIAFSNISSVHTSLTTTSSSHKGNRAFNTMLLIGCVVIGIFILILVFILIKCFHRDEGSYKIDESQNFTAESSHSDKIDKNGCGGKISATKQQRQKLLTANEQIVANSKEWYV
ncbi:unnamed protein product [Adineta steineri]|uniref:Neurexin/syndecan/glycophorin C domain-containing protein n=1 Tax=Adineta steineri TaxID=433720 RepID=A0A815DBL8_9BILA|nr:unnamed protein product [Adineta steineri]CAF1294156.1 unnamed protein product [Adineta steineri]